MLKKQKNLLFREVKSSGLDRDLFYARELREEGENWLSIEVLESPLRFTILESSTSHYKFRYKHSRFLPSFPESDLFPSQGWSDIEGVRVGLRHWLRGTVQRYLEEQQTPDLWTDAIRRFGAWNLPIELPTSSQSLDHSYDGLDEPQKTETRKTLQDFQNQMRTRFKLPAEQLSLAEDRLTYLSDALDRLSRFDWWALFVYTMITIFIALTLDTDRGERFLDLMRGLFETVRGLLA